MPHNPLSKKEIKESLPPIFWSSTTNPTTDTRRGAHPFSFGKFLPGLDYGKDIKCLGFFLPGMRSTPSLTKLGKRMNSYSDLIVSPSRS